MYQLSYQSTATHGISPDDIQTILQTARARNKEIGITGCLVFHNSCFIQIVEGKKKQVKSLFQDIKRDSRHNNIRLLWEGKFEERSFNDWCMGYFDSTNEGRDGENIKAFEQNLMLLSELSDTTSATLRIFWVGVGKLLKEKGC
ncbi:BLUF domain-containing protein [Arenibacter certesii]|uniref:BLUF domain-containing protein n=1 Tax=Arenibacter certesii TaxID=228955 RepID=A0A918IZ81_9FLAO|nr:BLUF domain-containing protein [Arenibacter certesii]GGW39787.1 hypothetical protein GCM10007383_25590 [Arenibacter certesii]